jgi:hypothetical protein
MHAERLSPAAGVVGHLNPSSSGSRAGGAAVEGGPRVGGGGGGSAGGSFINFNPDAVQRCRFSGRVVLGLFGASVQRASPAGPALDEGGWRVPSAADEGVFDSHIADAWIMSGARVARCDLVQNCVVMKGATATGCGRVGSPYGAAGLSSFSNGLVIRIGPETGGRQATVCAASDFECIARACSRHTLSSAAAADTLDDERATVAYASRCSAAYTVIGPLATVTGCSRVERSCVGGRATITGSVLIDSTVLGGCERDASVVSESHVERSIVQQGCTVAQKAVVIGSLMCCGSHVRRHGTLMSSVLASFSSVEEGEVGSSLVGPLVGFHHQVRRWSWVKGKGG